MKLFEFESKKLFADYGILVPKGYLATSSEQVNNACVVKAQVLAGKRGKAGIVKVCKTVEESKAFAEKLLNSEFNGKRIESVYCEELISFSKELFLSLAFDSVRKQPVLVFSLDGGVDIEEVNASNPNAIKKLYIDPLQGLQSWQAREFLKESGLSSELLNKVGDVCVKLYKLFTSVDARMAEVNPLAVTTDGVIATGAALILDDDAFYRHDWKFTPRSASRELTERELAAKKIDENDYRGVAGKYLELDGDIAMMTSGGGGSLTNMDALLEYGGKPANFTEYGGNPPREKMKALTSVILSKPGLNACWIVGGIANNTRVDVTFEGIADALRELKPKFPIIIRRAGPGEKEGFETMRALAKELGLDIQLFGAETPMTSTAKIVVDAALKYKESKK
ncbi:succinate--CoA ligase subunit beta [Candidatus Micrarchaeota archaeon]|nr:succinate--CoA ligase subunit beta [Candidatus Micrarchaeota archaeon]